MPKLDDSKTRAAAEREIYRRWSERPRDWLQAGGCDLCKTPGARCVCIGESTLYSLDEDPI